MTQRSQERMFPIQGGPAIPWAVIAPCDQQCKRNHGGQDLERIAERAGLGPSEAIDVLLAQRWGTTELRGVEAQNALAAIVKDRWYLPEVERLKSEIVRKEKTAWKPGVARHIQLADGTYAVANPVADEIEQLRSKVAEAEKALAIVQTHRTHATTEQRKWGKMSANYGELGKVVYELEVIEAELAALRSTGDSDD